MDTRDIIDQIDAVTGCHQCQQPLNGSPSDMFCSEGCQSVWQSTRVGGRRDTELRPLSRVFIQVGERAREAGNRWLDFGTAIQFNGVPEPDVPQGTWDIRPVFGTVEFTCTYFNRELWEQLFGDPPPERTREERMRDALEARRNRSTGPRVRDRAPLRLDPRRNR